MAMMDFASNKLGLFFYLATLDEVKTETFALEAYRSVEKQFKNIKEPTESMVNQSIVKAGQEYLNKKTRVRLPFLEKKLRTLIEFPPGADWGAWVGFKKIAEPTEFMAVLWVKVLNMPEPDVALALGISMGSLRFRLSRGLKLLGELVHKGHRHA